MTQVGWSKRLFAASNSSVLRINAKLWKKKKSRFRKFKRRPSLTESKDFSFLIKSNINAFCREKKEIITYLCWIAAYIRISTSGEGRSELLGFEYLKLCFPYKKQSLTWSPATLIENTWKKFQKQEFKFFPDNQHGHNNIWFLWNFFRWQFLWLITINICISKYKAKYMKRLKSRRRVFVMERTTGSL